MRPLEPRGHHKKTTSIQSSPSNTFPVCSHLRLNRFHTFIHFMRRLGIRPAAVSSLLPHLFIFTVLRNKGSIIFTTITDRLQPFLRISRTFRDASIFTKTRRSHDQKSHSDLNHNLQTPTEDPLNTNFRLIKMPQFAETSSASPGNRARQLLRDWPPSVSS